MALGELTNTQWRGQAELWLDPLGNQVDLCDCEIDVEADTIRYRWSYEGKPHTGTLSLRADGAEFTDTWHSTTPMSCVAAKSSWCLVDVFGTYPAGDGPDWGWRITLARRPDAELVLQMTNVAPWGEHGRAVRMICAKR